MGIGQLAISVSVAFVASGLQVELENPDGARTRGELLRLDTEQVELQTPQDRALQPTSQVRLVRRVDPAAETPAASVAAWIELTDGSRLLARDYQADDQQASIPLSAGVTAQLPTRAVRSVRFSAAQAELDRQWNEIRLAKVAGDVLIVRRPNQVLDYVVGQLGAADAERVKFLFEGNWIDVRRNKVDGMIYYEAAPAAFPAPKCRLTTCAGDLWNVQDLTLQGDQLKLTSNNGAQVSWPVSLLQTVEFGSSTTVYLSDLEPERVQWTPYVGIRSVAAELEQLFQPRRNQSLAGGPLRVQVAEPDGAQQEFEKGLSIHSRTELVYRLAGEYRQLAAVAGLDPSQGRGGTVIVVISADGVERWRQEIAADAPAIPIDMDVAGVNWLTVLVDFGDRADVADYLNLCDARLMK